MSGHSVVTHSRLARTSPSRRMGRCLLLPAALVAAVAATSVRAAESDAYIGASAYYMFADQDRNVGNPNLGIQVNPGFRLDGNWWLEGHLFGANLDKGDQQPTDFYHYGLGADIAYDFGDRDHFTPYVLVGGGANYNDVVPDADDGWDYFVNVGVGVTNKFFGLDLLRWRVEARALRDGFMDGMMDYRVAAGLEFALERSKPQKPSPEPTKIVQETTREVIREVPVPVAAAAMADQDLDHDGVINSHDKCPFTPEGAKVDGDGCVIAQTLTMKDVTFQTNSSRLTLNGQHILDQVAAFLKSDASVNLSIEGHTDAQGSDAYNLKLSQSRAESVRKYLIEKKIEAGRLAAKGYGESRPVANNDNEAGREANRRVEMVISKARK